LYRVARPIPVSSAICDMVTERSPSLATSAAAVSKVASRTARRWVSRVWLQSLGTPEGYMATRIETLRLCLDVVSGKLSFSH